VIQFAGVLTNMDISGYLDSMDISSKIDEMGLNELTDGVSSLNGGVSDLDGGAKKIAESSGQLRGGLDQSVSGLQQIIQNSESLRQLAQSLASFPNEQVQLLVGGYLAQLDAFVKVAYALDSLNVNYTAFDEAVKQLSEGITKIADGMAELNKNVADMPSQIDAKINEAVSSFAGSGEDYKVKSFMSEKNTSVKSVQFVLRTSPPAQEDTLTNTAEPVKELTFWQRLLKLFGLYKEG
jgi:putative membrane protein